MKRLFILLAVVFMTAPALAQKGTKLYKDLSEGMSIKEAKKMMKKNKDNYKEVSFGNGFMWTIKTTGLMSRKKGEDYLAGFRIVTGVSQSRSSVVSRTLPTACDPRRAPPECWPDDQQRGPAFDDRSSCRRRCAQCRCTCRTRRRFL